MVICPAFDENKIVSNNSKKTSHFAFLAKLVIAIWSNNYLARSEIAYNSKTLSLFA